MNKRLFFSGALFILFALGYAQKENSIGTIEELDEVVITNSKFELKKENSGKVITKISQKELQQQQGKSIAEIINSTVGIEINGTRSNAGQNLSYFVRGGRNRQVLILIDGIAVTDPSQIANDYDLRLLNADQVESIEILKGASSVLYGSGAATAIINIKLKEATKDKISGNFRSVLGSNQSQKDSNYAIEDFRNSVSLNGTFKNLSYLASFGNQYTNGLSAIADGNEADAFNSINGNLKLGYDFSESFGLNIYGSFDKYKADFDDSFTFSDADNQAITNQYRLGLSSKLNYAKGNITVNAAYNNIERKVESNFPTLFESESIVVDAFNRYTFNDTFFSVLGVNAQDNKMESFTIPFGETSFSQSIDPEMAKFTIVDPYLNVVYKSHVGLAINAGIRLNNHSEYGSHLVYSVNPSYKVDLDFGYLKGITSYSTAYITPSLFQLFEPSFGNPELNPEENATFEVGFELGIKNSSTISLVYFNRRESNFIDFVDLGGFVFEYNNIEEVFTASGLELIGNYKFSNKINLSFNAAYTKVDENLNLRIPEIKAHARLDFKLDKKTDMSIAYQYNDERHDSYFNNLTFMNESVTLQNYSLLDLYINRKVLKNKMTVFANVANIFNEDYQELFGFSTRGRNVNIGFNLSL